MVARRWHVRLLLTAAAPCVLASCTWGTRCTAIGCIPGVTIELTSALDPTATHVVDVTADEHMLSCTGSGPRLPVTCSPGLSLGGMGVETRTANAISLGPAEAFDRVSIEGTPQQIELTITSDAGTKSGVLAPKYTNEELNGPGCGTCRTGVVRFDNR